MTEKRQRGKAAKSCAILTRPGLGVLVPWELQERALFIARHVSRAIKAQLISPSLDLRVVMDKIEFTFLKYSDRIPVLAACTRCQLKFLTPSQKMKDWEAANEYLWRKYSDHHCASLFSPH
jgi:hypothetical protein